MVQVFVKQRNAWRLKYHEIKRNRGRRLKITRNTAVSQARERWRVANSWPDISTPSVIFKLPRYLKLMTTFNWPSQKVNTATGSRQCWSTPCRKLKPQSPNGLIRAEFPVNYGSPRRHRHMSSQELNSLGDKFHPPIKQNVLQNTLYNTCCTPLDTMNGGKMWP